MAEGSPSAWRQTRARQSSRVDTVPLTWQPSMIMGYMISAGHRAMSEGVGRSSRSGKETQGSTPVITLPPLPTTSLLNKAPVRHRD